MTILDTLAACARERTKLNKQQLTMEEITKLALAMNANTGFPFEKALAKPGMSFICEVKKASPSKGLIAPDFPYMQIAREYEAQGHEVKIAYGREGYVPAEDRSSQTGN